MLTQGKIPSTGNPGKNPVYRKNSPQRRIEPTTLHQSGQQAQQATSELFRLPVVVGVGRNSRPPPPSPTSPVTGSTMVAWVMVYLKGLFLPFLPAIPHPFVVLLCDYFFKAIRHYAFKKPLPVFEIIDKVHKDTKVYH